MKTSAKPISKLCLIAIVSVAATDQAAWKVDPGFQPIPTFGFGFAEVDSIQPDGKFIVAQGRQRLNADGSVDPSFTDDSGLARRIWVTPGGQLLGVYQRNQNIEINWLTAFAQPTPTRVELTTPFGLVDPQLAGFLADGRFVIYGPFTTVNGVTRPGLARINPDATLDLTFDPGEGGELNQFPWVTSPTDVELFADGTMLVAGPFSFFGGVPHEQIVRLRADGSVDPTFDTGAGFPSTSPQAWPRIAVDAQGHVWHLNAGVLQRLDADGSNAFPITGVANDLSALAQDLHLSPDGRILVSGCVVQTSTTTRAGLAQFNDDGTLDESFSADRVLVPGVGLGTGRVFVHASGIYVQRALTPTVYNAASTHALFRLGADGAQDPAFSPTGADVLPAPVTALAAGGDGKIVIAGTFSHVDGVLRPGLARFQADGSLDLTFAPTDELDGVVRALAVQANDQILVAGSFNSAAGAARAALARFNPDGSLDGSFDAGLNPGAALHALAVQADGAIVIGGTFSSIDGAPRANLARLLPDGTLDPAFAVTTGATLAGGTAIIRKIELLAGGQLLVAGAFDTWNGTGRAGVMRLHADGTIDAAFDPGTALSGLVVNDAAALADGSVGLAATGPYGGFSTILGRYVRLRTDGSLRFIEIQRAWPTPTTLGIASDGEGGALIAFGEDFGPSGPGGYSLPLHHVQAGLEHFRADDSRDNATSLLLAGSSACTLARDPSGAILVGGNFYLADGMPLIGALRLVIDTPPPRLANISTRGAIGTNNNVLIAGFYVSGTEPQRVLIRGIAHNLAGFGVTNLATNPVLHLYRVGESTPMEINYGWFPQFTAQTIVVNPAMRMFDRLGAFPLEILNPGSGYRYSFDAAFIADLPPGGYTVLATAATPGIGLVEIYDANGVGADRKLVNLSTRGRVGIDDEKLIAGFVIGEGTKRVLIRAVGPAIAGAVPGTLADPQIELVRQSDEAVIATNDNWGDNVNAADITIASQQVSGLQLSDGSSDAALLVDLPAGGYTVVVAGVGATSGIALVEVYEVE